MDRVIYKCEDSSYTYRDLHVWACIITCPAHFASVLLNMSIPTCLPFSCMQVVSSCSITQVSIYVRLRCMVTTYPFESNWTPILLNAFFSGDSDSVSG